MTEAIELDPSGGVWAKVMLVDAGQVADGKLNTLGAGWDRRDPGPATFCIAGWFFVTWAQTNRAHTVRWELVDIDGGPFELPAPDGGVTTLSHEGQFEIGRPTGVKPGTTLSMPFVMPFANVPFPAGGSFEWRLTINGREREDWRLPFTTTLGEGQAKNAA